MNKKPLPARSAARATLIGAASLACCGASTSALTAAPSSATPPGYSLARTGDQHDFDFFVGAWTTKQRRLTQRGVGGTDWEEFPAIQCLTP